MQYGVRMPNSGPFASQEALYKTAVLAEKLGFDALMTHDHVNWGVEDKYHFYCGSREAADAKKDPYDFFEVMTTLSYLAGVTKRVRLIPDALCLGWREIMVWSRQILTLHQLSKGRFVLCVCVGNVKKDFDMTSTPWDLRGKIGIEKLKVLRMLIDQSSPLSFEGERIKFSDAELNPRPAGLPLWYAGVSDIAIKRAARYADGWMPAASPDYFRRKIPELLAEAERVGRGNVKFEFATSLYVSVARTDEEAIKVGRKTVEAHMGGEWTTRHDKSTNVINPGVGSPDTVASVVKDYEKAGVHTLRLGFIGHSLQSIHEQMEMFAKEVMPRVKAG